MQPRGEGVSNSRSMLSVQHDAGVRLGKEMQPSVAANTMPVCMDRAWTASIRLLSNHCLLNQSIQRHHQTPTWRG